MLIRGESTLLYKEHSFNSNVRKLRSLSYIARQQLYIQRTICPIVPCYITIPQLTTSRTPHSLNELNQSALPDKYQFTDTVGL